MIDIISAVEELSRFASRELAEMLKDSDNFVFQSKRENGAIKQVDMEKLAASIPLHILAVCLSTDESSDIAYLLRGVRLLHTLSELASRHARLEQVLLDDVRFSEQVIDLVFFLLTTLSHRRQENNFGSLPFLHSTLVASSLHLLTAYISSNWHDIVQVLLAHPKVDIFLDVAFCSLHEDVRILGTRLSTLTQALCDTTNLPNMIRSAHFICQQCEASLQYILSLCQQKQFRDRVLKSKELCKNGAILSLAQAILRLSIQTGPNSADIASALSRMKAKILSILLQLCEAESISYLDEAASSPRSMQIAQSVALEVLGILKATFQGELKHHIDSEDRTGSMGSVVINALRLVDIFSDDSNFRYSFMTTTVPFLTHILSSNHEEFVSSWCSVHLPFVEEDANLEYDPFAAAGVALAAATKGCSDANSASLLLPDTNYNCTYRLSSLPAKSYAQTRTSCVIKIIANLDVFIPNICEEQERDLFLQNFQKYLLEEKPAQHLGHPSSDKLNASTVCKNLNSLSDYAMSLIPNLLNEEDVQLLRSFSKKLESSCCSQVGCNILQDIKAEPPLDDKGQTFAVQPQMSAWTSTNELASNSGLKDKQGTETSQSSLKQNERTKEENFNDDTSTSVGLSRSTLRQNLAQLNVSRNSKTDFCSDLNQPNIIIMGLKASKMDVDQVSSNASHNKSVESQSNAAVECKPSESLRESMLPEDNCGENVLGDERLTKRRKRTIMNEQQVNTIEKAVVDQPDMHKSAALLLSWAEKLSSQGPPITSSQLKNWLNNRKAKLARVAKESRNPPDSGARDTPDRNSAPATPVFAESPESCGDDAYLPPTRPAKTASADEPYVPPPTRAKGTADETSAAPRLSKSAEETNVSQSPKMDLSSGSRAAKTPDTTKTSPSASGGSNETSNALRPPTRANPLEPGRLVLLIDNEGKPVGKGKVHQVDGRITGTSLATNNICIVDITDLRVDKSMPVPFPAETGSITYADAAGKNAGVIRVAWDVTKALPLAQ